MVNANGDVITASSTSNPDVFWALRGSCSSSFGIISTITFKLHENVYGPNVTIFNPRDANWKQSVISGSDNVIQTALWFQSYATYNATPLMTMNLNFKANNQAVLEGVFMGPRVLALAYMLEPLTEGLAGVLNRSQIMDQFVEMSYLEAIVWWTNDKTLNTTEALVGVTALSSLEDRDSRRKAKSSLIREIIGAEGIQVSDRRNVVFGVYLNINLCRLLLICSQTRASTRWSGRPTEVWMRSPDPLPTPRPSLPC